jgi:hypothetical protein
MEKPSIIIRRLEENKPITIEPSIPGKEAASIPSESVTTGLEERLKGLKNPSFELLKEYVELSEEKQREFSLKVRKKPGDKPLLESIIGNEKGTSSFSSLMRLASDSDLYLSSHTHYVPKDMEYDPKLTILLSDDDFESFFFGTDSEHSEHLGSFFVPNPYGVTFVVGASPTEKHPVDYVQWVLEKENSEVLGRVNSFKSESLNLNETLSLSAYNLARGIVFHLVFVPYAQLDKIHNEQNIDLEQVLFDDGLTAIVKDTPFSNKNKVNKSSSTYEVILETKALIQKIRNDRTKRT